LAAEEDGAGPRIARVMEQLSAIKDKDRVHQAFILSVILVTARLIKQATDLKYRRQCLHVHHATPDLYSEASDLIVARIIRTGLRDVMTAGGDEFILEFGYALW
jgi:hypothetical protein